MVAACPFPYPRGTPVRILRMAESLAHRGHEVHVVTYHLGDELQRIPLNIHRIKNVKTYRKYSPGPTYKKLFVLDTLLAIKLFQVLRNYKIDLIHAHHYEGLIVGSLARSWTKHPLIYDAHTLLESELPFYPIGMPQKIKRIMGLLLDSIIPKWADHVISVTSGIRDKLITRAGISDEHISIIANGVESIHFQTKSRTKNKEKRMIKTLIYTGNLASYQGVDIMLQAFKMVIDHRNDTRLLIISNDNFGPYETLANQLGIRQHLEIQNIDFSGLATFLAEADIALNPRTECDGIPQKLLNYMAAGKPVVSFEGSAKNLEHGKTGWVVENYNIQAFSRGVIHLLENQELANHLGKGAANFVVSNYSWENTAEKVEAVYRNLLDRIIL